MLFICFQLVYMKYFYPDLLNFNMRYSWTFNFELTEFSNYLKQYWDRNYTTHIKTNQATSYVVIFFVFSEWRWEWLFCWYCCYCWPSLFYTFFSWLFSKLSKENNLLWSITGYVLFNNIRCLVHDHMIYM